MTRKRKSQLASNPDAALDVSASDDSKSQQKLPVRAKDGKSPKSASPPAKGTMKVFTDEDNDAAILAPALEVPKETLPENDEDEEEEDSDDEAPEAVSTSKVASEMKKSAQATQKAAQEQAAAEKRKRQQRDVLFKQQAEERKKAEEETKAVEKAAEAKATGRRRRNDKVQVPNLLPAEFLTDSSSEDEDDKPSGLGAPRSKKRKLAIIEKDLGLESRGPRDQRVGSTVYRVARKVDERTAPKLSKQSVNIRDGLLKRGRAAVPARRR